MKKFWRIILFMYIRINDVEGTHKNVHLIEGVQKLKYPLLYQKIN